MSKIVLKLIIVFVIGTIGGIFADQIFWPYFVEKPLFHKYRLEQAPINIFETKEITILENEALQNMVSKVEKAVIGLKSTDRTVEGSGVIITSDGLILVLEDLIPKDKSMTLFLNGNTESYQVIKSDSKKNLALIKIDVSNLPIVGIAEYGSLRYGQRIFLVGAIFGRNGLQKSVNEGIVKTYDEKIIETNISEDISFEGSPLFNIEGELIGLSIIDSDGDVSAISIKEIREFSGF